MTDRPGSSAHPVEPSPQPIISLRLPADHFYQAAIRRLVGDVAHHAGFPADAAAAIAMAVDEACANVVEHGYQRAELDPVSFSESTRLELQVDDRADRLVISILDRATPYHLPAEFATLAAAGPPRAVPATDASIRERGMGLAIIRRVMDDVQLDTLPDGGNCLRLTKYKGPQRPAARAEAERPNSAVRPGAP